MTRGSVSSQTRRNWLIDAVLLAGALTAAITGIYFLFLPTGGYQGGRNPMHGITILFDRRTWDVLHTWFGALMIGAAAIHLTAHWGWVKGMAKRMAMSAAGKGVRMNRHGILNVVVDAAVAIGFLLAAVSGIYFMYAGTGRAADPGFIFSRAMWDLVHTWSAVVMIVAAVVHFAIHWRWVTKVTARILSGLRPGPRPAVEAAAEHTGA